LATIASTLDTCLPALQKLKTEQSMKAQLDDTNVVASTPVQHQNRSYIPTRRSNSATLLSVLAGSLMLDTKGTVLTCTDALSRLCGTTEDDLVGRPVRSLLPEVPLGPGTEGYNVAFVAFFSGSRCTGSWPLLTANGDSVQVQGYFTLLKVEKRYLFRLELRWADDPSVALERHYKLRRRPMTGRSVWARSHRRALAQPIPASPDPATQIASRLRLNE
jgi:PAS domain-containing protein